MTYVNMVQVELNEINNNTTTYEYAKYIFKNLNIKYLKIYINKNI